jgi:hypothetical protein
MGRYSEELADRICERLIEGESLRTICADENMPSRATVLRWLADNPEFEAKCARARAIQADALAEDIQDVADSGNPDDVQRAKLRVSVMQWRAAKLAPKKYGDKVALTGGGEGDAPIKTDNLFRVVFVDADGSGS